MNVPTLRNPTGRNTQAHVFTAPNGDEFFFSYETCIGFRGFRDGELVKVRRANTWGPTTGRHMNEMGLKHFEIMGEELFAQEVGR